jgi:hypothetical protein
MLKFIKIVHTIIWAVMTASNLLAFYFALIGRFDYWFWLPASLIIIETLVVVFNHWRCPITKIAANYTENRKSNFDIYLPEWLAKYNVRIYIFLIPLEILIVLIRLIF